MTTRTTKEIIVAHFEALFAGDARVGGVIAARNLEEPEPPRTRAGLEKAWVWIRFTGTGRSPRGLPGAAGVPWDEAGAFMLMVLVGSNTLDALADEIFNTAETSLRDETIGDKLDVINVIGAEAGPKFGGNWWGRAAAVQFETQNI